MTRWQPDSPGRLETAALELFAERGFENTTVAEIAARAGVTERTFFRHYADKREVLFSGSAGLREVLVAAVVDAPEGVPPIDVVRAAMQACGEVLQGRRDFARWRHEVITANAELQERELIKLASLAAALAEALIERGVAAPLATLTAETGITVFKVAFERWVGGPARRTLPAIIAASFVELRSVTAGG